MYTIEELNFQINQKKILQKIDFSISANIFFAIMGPNGSGKSTLLKIINKNIIDYQGNIFFNNRNIREFGSKELALLRAVLSQSIDFPYNFQVNELVRMGLDIHNISWNQKKEIFDFVVQQLDIKFLLERNYQTLSGGQQQRVQLARVIAQLFIGKEKNKFLFLDEPTLNLDIYQQYIILDLLKKLNKEHGWTICAVLHDLHQAYLYSQQLLVLQEGKVAFFGKSKKILTQKNIAKVFEVDSDIISSKKLQQKFLVTKLAKKNQKK